MNVRLLLRAGVALGLGCAPLCLAQTTLDGVFAEEQARRGARTYNNICAECHEGAEPDGDPLMGPVFIERWRDAPLAFLYGFMSTEMPGNDAGGLSADTYLDVLAYLLSANGYAAGGTLTHEQLGAIQFVDARGPQPLPLYNLVKVVGCLAKDGASEWRLLSAGPLARVRTGDETNAAELAASAATAAGEENYKLHNAGDYSADMLDGRRVQVKGVLTAHGPPAAVNVLSLAAVSDSACQATTP